MSYYNGKFYTAPDTFKFRDNEPETLQRDCVINEVRIMEQDEWFDELEMFNRLGFINDEGYIVLSKGTSITLQPAAKGERYLRRFSINNTNDEFTVSTLCSIDGLLADAILNTPETGEGYSIG